MKFNEKSNNQRTVWYDHEFKGTETLIKLYDENTIREEMYLKNIKYKANRNIKPRKEDNEITKNWR